MFDIALWVAKKRFWFYANICSVVNAANQLGIVKDETADRMNRDNFFKCMDALERMGYDVKGFFDDMSKSE